MRVISLLILLVGCVVAYNSVSQMNWQFMLEGKTCSDVSYDTCVYCNGQYYKPYKCDYAKCNYGVYSDSECTKFNGITYDAFSGTCDNIDSSNTCDFFYSPAPLSRCKQGCTLPTLLVEAQRGLSVYHRENALGPALVHQFSTSQAYVAGRLTGHYFEDGGGERLSFEGFITEDTYLTSAGFCTVGTLCSAGEYISYGLSMGNITVDTESNSVAFRLYSSAAIGSTAYNESRVVAIVESFSTDVFLLVDSEWDLSDYFIETASSYEPSGERKMGTVFADMMYASRNGNRGVLGYRYQNEDLNFYKKVECKMSDSVPLCFLDEPSYRVLPPDTLAFSLF